MPPRDDLPARAAAPGGGVDARLGTRPRPLAEAPPATWADVAGVLTDIDDTLTRDGAIEPAALAALHALAAAGLPVVAVTGRPMGWSRPFAATWPLRSIVAENGAVMLWRDADGTLQVDYAQDAATRAAHAVRLRAAAARILAEVPGATLAQDSPGRVTDIAIDHAEHARLDAAAVARVVALMHAQGLHATVSSIHVNGWFGDHDKWTGACWALRARLGRELADETGRWVYVGDSTNDQAMFARFALSVGVANLRDFADRLHTWPAWITASARGAGFAELAAALLAARAAAAPPDLRTLTPALRATIGERIRAPGARALPAEGRRHAAVALAIVEEGHGAALPGLPGHAHWSPAAALLLTRRAPTLRSHAGQWALPGGRIDAGETAEQAALRELHEELGLALGPEAVLGRLDDYATRSGYVVTPVVVWAGAARGLRPQPGEVASVHRLPLAELLRADAPMLNTVRRSGRTVLRMPLGDRWIAAPTAAFLYQFREWALCGRPTRVAHLDQPAFAWR